ncbi:MAG: hypothetical protein ACR2MY_03315 [Candidatus Dormibacteria bacterium]
MKSVRLGVALESRLRRAAQAAQLPECEIIRQGVTRRVDEIVSVTVWDQIKDLIIQDDGGPPHPALPTDQDMAEEMSRDELMHRRVINPRS